MNNPTQPLVTIAIPTFNRAASYLPLSLASAVSQTYPHLEILVSDNCSEDGTRELIASLGDGRVRYHRHKSNIGARANEAFCLQDARGSYMMVLPDDDMVDPAFVESCMLLAACNPGAALIRSGTRVIDGQGKLLSHAPNSAVDVPFEQYVNAWIDGRTAPYQCSSLYRTDALRSIGLRSRHNLFNDLMTHFKVAAQFGRLDIAETMASFRQHGSSETDRTAIRDWCEESNDVVKLLCELVPDARSDIRSRATRFLAFGNYRRAFRKTFPESLLSVITVWRTHGFIPPPRPLLAEYLRRLRR